MALLVTWPRLARSPIALVPANDPWVRLDAEITEQFGMALPVVWLVEARGDTIWTGPALARVDAITQAVLRIPGVIATDVTSIASPNLRDLRVVDDALAPVYLMPAVPTTDAEIAALRRRVEGDPMLHGALVSRDGRAALVVGSFQASADPAAVARAALAVRERARDDTVDVWVVGAPVQATLAPAALRRLALPAGLWVAAIAAALAWTLGWAAVCSAAGAGLLAAVWGAVLAVWAGTFVLPWGAFALVAVALATAAARGARGPRPWAVPLALAAGGAALGLAVGQPAGSFGWTLACGLTVGAAWTTVGQRPADVDPDPTVGGGRLRTGLLAAAAMASAGVLWLRPGFGLAGYAERWLPPPAANDVQALRRHFPPPSQLAIRLRGEPGFVAEPAVLHALDRATAAARADPATTSAMSVADLVALVHRALAGDEATTRLPDDRGLVARYLALAYSPGFRRVLDRGLRDTALWVQLGDDDPRALTRVLAAVSSPLRTPPPPGVTIDVAGGDGAVVLVAARVARRVAAATALLLAVASATLWFCAGGVSAARSLAGGTLAAAVAAGLLGWCGLRIDLITVAAVATAAVAGAGVAGGRARTGLALVVAAALPLLAPAAVGRLLGILLAAPALAGAALRRSRAD